MDLQLQQVQLPQQQLRLLQPPQPPLQLQSEVQQPQRNSMVTQVIRVHLVVGPTIRKVS